MRKKTLVEVLFDFRVTHGDTYDYSLVEYISSKSLVKILCKVDGHGIFEQSPASHIHQSAGCPKCFGKFLRTKEEFIIDAQKVHGDLYDYSLVKNFNSAMNAMIGCPYHGLFSQKIIKHLSGRGCPTCGNFRKGMRTRKSLDTFIIEANNKHAGKFDYSLVEYINSCTDVSIICPNHGVFTQTPNNHLNNVHGCLRCSTESIALQLKNSIETFISNAVIMHGNTYDYSMVRFNNNKDKIKIGCVKHGIFSQKVNSHLSGQGCPKCVGIISVKETKWLDMSRVPIRQYTIKGINFIPDGYDPETNTIYEFLGDFWHGNPSKFDPDDINPRNKKTFGQLYQETMDKLQKYRDHGYNVIYIWESDWDAQQKARLNEARLSA